jgi:osmotically-inducible protein OsmY
MNLRRLGHFSVLVLTLAAGCNRQDTEALTRIGKKLVSRADSITGDLQSRANTSWHTSGLDLDLEGRVAARLRWDKQLADTPLEVEASGGVVELRGQVRDLDQHRRAIMLAESTAGVEGVKDSLVEAGR